MLRCIFVSQTTAAFELDNKLCYNASVSFFVTVNGEKARECSENVFSLFDLEPDTEYTVGTNLDDYTVSIRTLSESVCVSVRDFGAAGDGVTDDTDAIQAAIDTLKPNGRVSVPRGVYLTRPILLKSDMTLELKKGAVLLGSVNEDDYRVLPGEIDGVGTGEKYQISSFEGTPAVCRQSFVSAFHSKNIIVAGEGTLDGNAQNSTWWINPKQRKIGRPKLFFTNGCENVCVHGITAANSPAWTFHPFFTKNFSLLDARVNAPKDSPNTDGCDPESCDGVNIIGTVFSVGDDCVAIKSGKRYMGEKYNTPAANHTIRNCLMRFGHGGVVLGSEMSGGVKNLSVEKCLFVETDRGLRIKTRRGRGKNGVIDGVVFDNIEMRGVLTPLVINMFYFCDADGKSDYVQSPEAQAVDDGTPYLGSFTFKNLVCTGCAAAAGYFAGLPEQPIESVEIENVTFAFDRGAAPAVPAMRLNIEATAGAGVVIQNVNRFRIKNVVFEGIKGDAVNGRANVMHREEGVDVRVD